MAKIAYKVIWADDECDSLCQDKTINRCFDAKGIEVIKYAHTSDELRGALERFYDQVDAVIVDGNFSRSGELEDDGEHLDITGLVHTLSFIDTFNQKRDIPFFLFTGKKSKIQEMCNKYDMLAYFIETGRIYQKGEIDELTNAIIKDVEHIHSIENFVTQRYDTVLKMASKIGRDEKKFVYSARDLLFQFLLDEARDRSFDKAVTMFANLRQIVEQIYEGCKNMEIMPTPEQNNDKDALNYFKRYWDPQSKLKLRPVEGVMPKALVSMIPTCIPILQDGSHATENLHLDVSEYVAASQTPYMFRMQLYFVLNLIDWFVQMQEVQFMSYWKVNPYFRIHYEFDKKTQNKIFKYEDFFFDRNCLPSEGDIGKDIQITESYNKTIKQYYIIEDED